MRLFTLSLALVGLYALSACTSAEQGSSNQTATSTTTSSTTTNGTTAPPTKTSNTATANEDLAIAPAHGGTVPPAASNSSSAAANSSASEPTGIDTSALDAKIEKAEAKAKAKNATQADKLAAAAAYLERADIFMNAGRPSLYKYALRDYRRTLRYQPDNKQAQESANTIVSIYQSMGRPVPELGNEP